jgi:hypothetical protein
VQAGYRIAVAVDAVSFAGCALLLALVRVRRPDHRDARRATGGRGPMSDRVFLAVIVATGLIALPGDFYLSGIAVYAIRELHTRPWLPGTAIALSAGLNSVGATLALRVTRGLQRTTVLILGAGLFVICCAACATAPPRWSRSSRWRCGCRGCSLGPAPAWLFWFCAGSPAACQRTPCARDRWCRGRMGRRLWLRPDLRAR